MWKWELKETFHSFFFNSFKVNLKDTANKNEAKIIKSDTIELDYVYHGNSNKFYHFHLLTEMRINL